jgi:release factor glutamine methyltransferase
VNGRQALARVRCILANSNIEDPPLEGEILLRHALGMSRSQLYTDLDINLTPAQEKALEALLERRVQGEPSAYITGHREFYGLDFHVDRRVLIPRPESELLVEKALELARNGLVSTVADIGTGCGAIAVSLAVNLPGITVYATDISPAALEVARTNCRQHNVEERVILLPGSLLEPLPGPVDLIVANLPYVREADLPRHGPLRYEPVLALNGGKDGLDGIRLLCRQARDKLDKRGSLLLEVGEGQAEYVADVLREAFGAGKVDRYRDLAGIERVVGLRLT